MKRAPSTPYAGTRDILQCPLPGLRLSTNVATRLHIGTFELTRRIGAGGMAEVWHAEHATLGTSVAVKVITGDRASDARFVERFIREVQSVARLNHPGIVRVHDYGRVEGAGGHGIRTGSPYLVMELADQGAVEDHAPDTWAGLRRVLLHVLDALAYSHARGVVHRDIKPGNVLLARGTNQVTRAKLTDFGIAHADDPDTDVSRGGLAEAAGTPEYMPPEQLQGLWRDYGPGTDLYAVGIMAWEIAAGSPPFSRKGPDTSPIQIALAHLTDDLPEFKPRFAVPAGFEDWLHRMLEKKPHKRFARAADAAYTLARLLPPAGAAEPPSKVFLPGRPQTGESTDAFSYADLEDDEATMIVSLPANMPFPTGGGGWSQPAEEEEEDATTVLKLSDFNFDQSSTEKVDPLDDEFPPIPRDWRRDAVETETVVAGMGLGLFGLREIPFVGRDDERDVIWQALQDVQSSGKSRAVVVNGGVGSGKSRLVQWITERAEEVGGATVMRAVHGPTQSKKHGISHMLERFFVTWRMDGFEPLRVRVQDKLSQLYEDEDVSLEYIDHESRALATLAGPDVKREAGQEVSFSSTDERVACVQRLLSKLTQTRPLILWIDDAHWADEALHLARAVLERSHPILVLLTVRNDVGADESVQNVLDEIARLPSTKQVSLTALEPQHQFELVQKLVGLDHATAEKVVRATGGSPLFATQLVGHWVDQGALIPTHDGFRVKPGADVPTQIATLWEQRVTDLVTRLGGRAQRRALELAATLGDDVMEVEWQATCFVADVEPHERLIDDLVDQGLVERFEGGFSFRHKMLADAIRSEARRKNREKSLNATVGEVLDTIYAHEAHAVATRVAEHYVIAGEWEKSLQPLGRVLRKQLAAGAFADAQESLDHYTQALDALAVSGFDRRRVENWLFQAQVHLAAGSPGEAELEFQRVLNVASPQRWREPVALAQRGLGELAFDAGNMNQALDAFNSAEDYFGADADPSELATLFEARADVHTAMGNATAACQDLERALDLHRTEGDSLRELNVFNRLASALLADGAMETAREVAEIGIERGREVGNLAAEAGCWTVMGEVERNRGDFEAARRCYAEAERLDELSGSRHIWVVRTAKAMVELAAENWASASKQFDELELELNAVGLQVTLPVVWLGQSVCHVAYGDFVAFDECWSKASAEIERGGLVERDLAHLAERVGELCERRKDTARARQALLFAALRWDDLGEIWHAREIRRRIRANTQ